MNFLHGCLLEPLALLLLAAASVAHAQSCVAPIPFQYEFSNAATTSLSAATPSDPCALSVAMDANARSTGAGFLHYQGAPLTSARYSFQLDTSALTSFTSPVQRVQIFSVNGQQTQPQQSHLLIVMLMGGSPNPTLRILAGTGTGTYLQAFTPVSLTQTSNVLRFEITIGSGTQATVSYWINHDFTATPDGFVMGLENDVYGGIVGAELGLSSPSISFVTAQNGRAVVFDQIQSSDDALFYDDFSDGAQ